MKVKFLVFVLIFFYQSNIVAYLSFGTRFNNNINNVIYRNRVNTRVQKRRFNSGSLLFTSTDDVEKITSSKRKKDIKNIKQQSNDNEYDGDFWDDNNMEGFDWELEKARRLLEGPAFAPIRMTLWQPIEKKSKPNAMDQVKILLNNALQMAGWAESLDGAPLVTPLKIEGNPIHFLSKVIDGDLAELAGGPLFLLLQEYYKSHGSIFKLAFGPKSFIVISDPIIAKHILKDSSQNYDKGILAEILEPVMGKGLIPADPETWKVRRKAIVPGFHKSWLNAMVSKIMIFIVICIQSSSSSYVSFLCYDVLDEFVR